MEQPAKIRPARPWPAEAPVIVPEPFSRSAGQSDFYRSGYMHARDNREPMPMDGYPATFALAYAAGWQDGARS